MDSAEEHALQSAAAELVEFMKGEGIIYDDDEVWGNFKRAIFASVGAVPTEPEQTNLE